MIKKEASGYRLILGYLGIFLIFASIICFLPLGMLIFYPEDSKYIWDFLIPGLSALAVGIGLFSLIFRRERARLGKHQDQVLLVIFWLFSVFVCALPFFLSGNMTFTESVFESVSGFATVGLSRFTMYDSHIFVFYRSLLLFFGGIGLVLIVTSALSDRYGLRLYIAEGHNDKLMPNLTKSARLILLIYAGYILLGTVAFMFSGMELFDAFNISVSAISTGGFTTKAEGFLACGGNATVNQIIACVLMVLGGTNFLIHFFLITGRLKRVVKDIEIRFFGMVCVVLIPCFIIGFLVTPYDFTFGESVKYGIFTFISSITTSGLSNTPANFSFALAHGVVLLVILCSIIGGGMGSTSGGSKQYRFALAFKSFIWNVRYRSGSNRMVYPHQVYRLGQSKEVSQHERNEALGYILLYVTFLIFGTFILIAAGGGDFSFEDCFFEFANGLSSAGLTCGLTTQANPGMLWVMIIGMFAGRLEIMPIYYAIYRSTRDIVGKETV